MPLAAPAQRREQSVGKADYFFLIKARMLLTPDTYDGSTQPGRGNGLLLPVSTSKYHRANRWNRYDTPSLRNLPGRLLYALTPTLLRKESGEHEQSRRNDAPTAWMDGLRGICALTVFNFHFLFAFSNISVLGYGTPSWPEPSSHFAALPPFCFLWDGGLGVNVFFAIAGYVCSLRAVELMQAGPSSYGQLLKCLSTSVFRRGFRLYLPVIAMTLMVALFAYCHGFILTDHMFADVKTWFPGPTSEKNLPAFKTLRKQLAFWWMEMSNMLDLWAFKPIYPIHDPHLWTVLVEYRMSLHLYGALLALATCRPIIRLLVLCMLAVAYTALHRWEAPLFFFGAAWAQWEVMNRERSGNEKGEYELEQTSFVRTKEYGTSARSFPLSLTRLSSVLRVSQWGLAFYLMGYPIAGWEHPSFGYGWVNQFIPLWYHRRENKFPKSVGALMFLRILATSPPRGCWRRILESGTALYLGKIMYAFYLVHGTVQHAVGFAIPHYVWAFIGDNTLEWQWLSGMLVGWIICLVMTLWAADVFHREVEIRCVRLTKFIVTQCIQNS